MAQRTNRRHKHKKAIVTGTWNECDDKYYIYPMQLYKCSECGYETHFHKYRPAEQFKFCPNCGTKMVVKKAKVENEQSLAF